MGINNLIDVSVYQKAKKNNYYCGDSYFFTETDNEFICVLADGLGSGIYARESSQAVINIIEENYHTNVENLISKCQHALIGKRGVVLGILKVDLQTKKYYYYSIGNIGIMTYSDSCEKKLHIPNSGYLGNYTNSIKTSQGELTEGTVLLMFSDGVKMSDLSSKYIVSQDVQRITEAFDFMHADELNDDATLIAMKCL